MKGSECETLPVGKGHLTKLHINRQHQNSHHPSCTSLALLLLWMLGQGNRFITINLSFFTIHYAWITHPLSFHLSQIKLITFSSD